MAQRMFAEIVERFKDREGKTEWEVWILKEYSVPADGTPPKFRIVQICGNEFEIWDGDYPTHEAAKAAYRDSAGN